MTKISILGQPHSIIELPISPEAFDETFDHSTLPPVQLAICSKHGQVLNILVLVATVEFPNHYSVVPRVKDFPEIWMAELLTKLPYPLGISPEQVADVQRSLQVLGIKDDSHGNPND